MANECQPLFRPGNDITAVATAAVTGKRFVDISATRGSDGLCRVGPPAAGAAAFGVAAYDALTGERLGVLRAGVLPVTAGGSITAGAEVQVTATGSVVALSSGRSVGKVIEAATAGQDVMVALAIT